MGGQLVLVRHGQTQWSRQRKHTGLTDVPLDVQGEQQAGAAGILVRELLAGRSAALVLTSPLTRARHTAELAGFQAELEPALVEWDYGGYEGLTTPQIRELTHPQWTVFTDKVVAGDTPGETLEQVAERCADVLARARPALADGDVVVFGHGHALRVLAACWLEADLRLAAQLLLDAGGVCVLGHGHGIPGLQHWNLRTAP